MADLAHLLRELAQEVQEVDDGQAPPLPSRLCRSAAHLLDFDGGAITLAYTEPSRVTIAATDPTAEEIEGLQEVVQQGPGADAYRSSQPQVLVADGDRRDSRWPLLDLTALDGARPLVVHAVPLRQGRETFGVMTLWRRGSTAVVPEETGLLVADIIAAALVDRLGVEDGESLAQSWATRAEVHQAVGFVVAQLGLRPRDALALVRAHAFARGQTMPRTARDVIERRLTFRDLADDGTQAP